MTAGNGRQAVEIFAASQLDEFDAILMDVRMPVMGGYEATRAIRSMDRPDAKTVPIIAMTANAYREDVEAAMQAGMNGHLAKPFHLGKFMDTLKKYLEKKAKAL